MSSVDNDTSFYETYDTMHVREKFPDASQFLASRLGRAISRRRQYLKYRESHHKKLSHGMHPDHDAEQDSTEIAQQSTAAFGLPNVEGIDLNDACSETASSFASTATSVNPVKLRPSPLPEEAKNGKPSECPLCFMIVAARDHHSWREHVYRDLHPYVCTFEDCATPDRLFAHRNEWFEHENRCICAIGNVWNAVIKLLHQNQRSGSNFGRYGIVFPVQQELALYLQFRRHLAKHQKQLALFALPSNVQQDNDDGDNGIPKPEALDIGAQGYSDDAGPDTVTEYSNSDSDTEIYAIRCAGIRLPIVATSAVDMDD
ncbi:hypothetical protein CPC735_036950 [Coccidioides posadasii C735 delta SOWgp]|uniref:Oxidoreductase acuF-like C2H2 type zinc-finger domain-containing protein n=1 Tax=Coccidioides posadasii (strain C735) TaxID=222929 RepID=C5P286_COCP7|nr:hypothetical protein CPC735_036950 [Coccidioides posadasii C735 delta SOWgp]EER28989.1 hypothetical protein CPC735_036950 [Coccidioides posadasii C735 delta SOWgp]|eukprot:XP_003071134.1 hypothetical protein CPC735_036950 [Coccidioides posadasii C735 delta SOWgp]